MNYSFWGFLISLGRLLTLEGLPFTGYKVKELGAERWGAEQLRQGFILNND